MILSKKYKEELDKIVMSEDMKKRILHNVLKENIEAKSDEMQVKKHRSLKRNMQMIAACFTVVVCVSIVKNNPQILKVEDRNMEQEEMIKDKDGENKDLHSSQVDQPDNVSKNSSKSEGVMWNNSEANDISKNKKESSEVAPNNGQTQNFQKDNGSGEGSENNNEVINVNSNNDEVNELINNNDGQSPKISNENSGDSNKNGNSSKEKQKESNSGNLVASSVPSIALATDGSVNKSTEIQKPIDSDNSLKSNVITKDETTNADKNENSQLEMRNPIKEYKTLEEAEGAVKFKINTIKSMPKGFNIDNLSVISNEIIEITYKNNEQDVINFRAGKEIDNISGDYNTYKTENTENINGISVELKGDNNKINLATWKNGEISYSIHSLNGSDKDIILSIVKSSL